MRRHLVTGGAGFIGSHIVEALVGKGEEVVVVDDLSSGSRKNLARVAEGVRLVVGDVCDSDLMADACAGVDVVFHLAALTSVPESLESPLAFNRVDVEGTLVALVRARKAGVRRFLLAGSCSSYGEGRDGPAVEEETGAPLSPYAAAKHAAEAYCASFRNAFGFDAVVLRFFNVYGPRQRADSAYAAVIPRFFSALLDGERPVVFGTGKQTRDLIYVGDVVAAALAVMEAQGPLSPVYNVGTGLSTSVLEVLREAAAALELEADPDFQPARDGDILHSLADISKIRREAGFEPSVSFGEGMRRTAEWFKRNRDSTEY